MELEIDKYYTDRIGNIVKIVKITPEGVCYSQNGDKFLNDGSCSISVDFDLLEEMTEQKYLFNLWKQNT